MTTKTDTQTENQTDTPPSTTENTRSYNDITLELDVLYKERADNDRKVKMLQKEKDRIHLKEVKNARKNKRRVNTASSEKKEPSGFNKPSIIPMEFCKQPWGCHKGDLVPRTSLTKMVYDYIKLNDLQDKNDRRIIHPDKHVRELFHMNDGDHLEFKTFQTYMANLYKKAKAELLLAEEKEEPEKEEPKIEEDNKKVVDLESSSKPKKARKKKTKSV